MIFWIIYITGSVVNFFLSIYLQRKNNDVTLTDLILTVLISLFSWAAAISALITAWVFSDISSLIILKRKD